MMTGRLIPIGLLLVTAIAFCPVYNAQFLTLDDNQYVTLNPVVRSGLSWEGVKWAFISTREGNWHPITWVSLMVDAWMWGVSSRAFHLHNLAIHLINVLLLYAALGRMRLPALQAAIIAAIWAVHPLRVESVAWVAERKDVLAMMFGLLAVWNHLGTNRSSRLTALFMALSLMCKPLFVTMPLLLILLDYGVPAGSRVRGFDLQSAIVSKWPLWLLSIGISIVAIVSQSRQGATSDFDRIDPLLRTLNATIGCSRYLFKHFWPVNLAAIYQLGDWISWGGALMSALILASITTFCWRLRRTRPLLMAGWAWYLVSLLPMIGLVQVGSQSIANRYTYLPGVGLLIFLSGLIPARGWQPGLHRRIPAACFAAIVATLGVLAFRQAVIWQDSIRLYEYTLASAPHKNWLVMSNLAIAYNAAGRNADAEPLYRRVLEIYPERIDAMGNLAVTLLRLNRPAEAVEWQRRLVSLQPSEPRNISTLGLLLHQSGRGDEGLALMEQALAMNPPQPECYNNLANVMGRLGNTDRAIELYRRCLQLHPLIPEAIAGLAGQLAEKGRVEQAIPLFEQAIGHFPKSPLLHMRLGTAYYQIGRRQEGLSHLRLSLKIDPDFVDTYYNLGTLFLFDGQYAQAIEQFQHVLKRKPDYAKAWAKLAASYRGAGDVPAAIQAMVQALALAPNESEWKRHLENWRDGK